MARELRADRDGGPDIAPPPHSCYEDYVLLQQVERCSEEDDVLLRNGTFPVMAGKSPADAAQPSGMNGRIVTVPMNAAQDPSHLRLVVEPLPIAEQQEENEERGRIRW